MGTITMPLREVDYPNYPGLNPQAADLWRTWLRLYEPAFENFQYNVRVGQGLDPGPGATDALREMWRQVTTKRVDVVAHRLNESWIIEIEPRPGLRTLGQLTGYAHLGPKYISLRPVLVLAVISTYIGFDMFGAFRSIGALVFAFPPGKAPNLPPNFQPVVSPAG